MLGSELRKSPVDRPINLSPRASPQASPMLLMVPGEEDVTKSSPTHFRVVLKFTT